MKYWPRQKVLKQIYWDSYWIKNSILTKELLVNELIRLDVKRVDDDNVQGRTRLMRLDIIKKAILNFNKNAWKQK